MRLKNFNDATIKSSQTFYPPEDDGCSEMWIRWGWVTKSAVISQAEGLCNASCDLTLHAPTKGVAFIAQKQLYRKVGRNVAKKDVIIGPLPEWATK